MSDDERGRSRDRDRSKRERPSRFADQSRDRSIDKDKNRGGTKSQCRVYVSNIPYEYRWQDLKDLFRNQVGDVAFVELFVDNNDKPRGCGIVEFCEASSVKKCLDVMHRFELKGRKMVIKEDYGNQRDKFGNIIGTFGNKRVRDRDDGGRDRFREDRHSSSVGGGGGGAGGSGSGNYDSITQTNRLNSDTTDKWGNTYGLSPQFLNSLGINLPLINRVFVANLDYKVDKKKLKEVFRLAGKIQKVELSFDRDGKSRGFAVIEYDHPVEAVQSISMFHDQILYDRLMTVRMDREGDRVTTKLPDGLKGVGMGLGLNGEPLKDVARNLPSNNPQPSASANAGLLGAVPAIPLGIGGALTNLNSAVSSSAFNTLGTNAAVLQAANLAGVGGLSSNLLANTLSSGDLGLAASLVNNPLVQNQSLAALANSANIGSGTLANAALNTSSFQRNENNHSYLSGNQHNNSSGFQSSVINQRNFEDQKESNFNLNTMDRDNRNNSGNVYSTINNGSLRSSGGASFENMNKSTDEFSNKILISNLPPTASYKMLNDKCNEFGNVQRIDDRNGGNVLVTFATAWEAERAIKNMDRARIDGRTINVRFF